MHHLWVNAQNTLRYGKDEERRKQAQATLDWIRNLVRKYHPEWDWGSDQIDNRIEDFLWKLNDEGCNYAADINALMQQYSITDLRKRFGIPDDVPDSQVKDWLLLDYYASRDNHNPSRWPWSWGEDTYDEHEDPKETDGRGMNFFDEQYRLHRWLEGYGINASVSLPRPVNIPGGMDAMKDDLCKGKHVILNMSRSVEERNDIYGRNLDRRFYIQNEVIPLYQGRFSDALGYDVHIFLHDNPMTKEGNDEFERELAGA